MTTTELHPMTHHSIPPDIAVSLIDKIDAREPDAAARLYGVLAAMVGDADVDEAIRCFEARRRYGS